jgi:hypothetical protein
MKKIFCWLILFGLGLAGSLSAQDAPTRANPESEARVLKEINKHHMEMMLRKWWNLPTDKEATRKEKGFYSRYFSNFMPIGGENFMAQAGNTFYRRMSDTRVLPEQNVVAMGWHPAWYTEDTYLSYNYGLLSHIAYYSYELNPYTGSYRNFDAIYRFKYSDFVPTAHLDTCDVLLTVSCRAEDAALFFTGEEIAKENLIDSLKSILMEAGADGIEISFEEVPRAHKDEFNAFVRDLSYELREEVLPNNKKYTIMMSVPVYDKDNVYDLQELRAWVDNFIIAGFNHHVTPLGLVEAPIAPSQQPEARMRGTNFTFTNYLNLDSVVRMTNYNFKSIIITQDKETKQLILDSLNFYIKRERKDLSYREDNIEDIVGVLAGDGTLRDRPFLRKFMSKFTVLVELGKSFAPEDNKQNFFLFKPEYTDIYLQELEQFALISRVLPYAYVVRDSAFRKLMHDANPAAKGDPKYDIVETIREYVAELGAEYKTALVMGLPYQGAVWNVAIPQPEFEGYLPYAQIRRLIDEKRGMVKMSYDKYYSSMILEIMDSTGATVRKVYFDNSGTLEHKIEMVLNEGIGGISMWALGLDYGYPELWKLFEQSFALPRVYNPVSNKFEKLTLAKSNKVSFTIQYQLKRVSRVVFATFFMIAILMIIGFNVVLLDWKVRDVLFYTGSFRIFYVTLFTMMVLFLGAYVNLFKSAWVIFLMGMLLGLTLTWLATVILFRQQARLP